ncbi:MAG TPA: hypothetical protein VEJ84_05460 [Acidimicrobiales bacterium]|nr:hypothetical protein [Acidimicrobiales bacterium]
MRRVLVVLLAISASLFLAPQELSSRLPARVRVDPRTTPEVGLGLASKELPSALVANVPSA